MVAHQSRPMYPAELIIELMAVHDIIVAAFAKKVQIPSSIFLNSESTLLMSI